MLREWYERRMVCRAAALFACLLGAMACAHREPPAQRMPLGSTLTNRLTRELGDDTIHSVETAERVMFAELGLVAADEAQQPSALSDPARVGGYPMTGDFVALEPTAARDMTQTLLARPNYATKLRWRCLPERVVGFRFVTRTAWVDATFTEPCGSVVWSRSSIGTHDNLLWGAVLRDAPAETIRAWMASRSSL
jgi:hypothetical protein